MPAQEDLLSELLLLFHMRLGLRIPTSVRAQGTVKPSFLQKMILEDMQELKEGRGSIVVIDSQGDLINKLMHIVRYV